MLWHPPPMAAGCGRTRLAVALGRAAIREGCSVLFTAGWSPCGVV